MPIVYLGNTLINDIFLGDKMTAVDTRVPASLVTSSLVYYFDASISASAANWRTVQPYGNRTGSLTQTAYKSTAPQSFELTGSVAEINFGATPTELRGTATFTVIMFLKQKNNTQLSNLTWWGNSSADNIELQVTGSTTGAKFLRFANSVSSSIAYNNEFKVGDWNQVALTVTGSTYAGVTLWVNGNKQTFTGADSSRGAGTLYWSIGTNNSTNPLSGSVTAYLVYNRVLSDVEIIDNYKYFGSRV